MGFATYMYNTYDYNEFSCNKPIHVCCTLLLYDIFFSGGGGGGGTLAGGRESQGTSPWGVCNIVGHLLIA